MENTKAVKEAMQGAAFQMIAIAGTAKSEYLEAVTMAREGKFVEAFAKIEEGRTLMADAHHLHFEFITREANEEDLPFSLIFMHAEDQLLTTEVIELMCTENIRLYEALSKK